MNDWLKSKTAGLPRWAWIALLGGGLAVGLYLRSRSTEEAEPEEEETYEVPEGSLSAYEGTDAGAGLAAAGLVGPAAGSVIPVEAPYIPEGLVDILSGSQQVIGALAEREPGERVEVVREIETEGLGGGIAEPPPSPVPTGGGAPRRKPARDQRRNRERQKAVKEINRLTNEIKKLRGYIKQHPRAKKRKGWETNIKHKQRQRQKWQAKLH